MILFLVLYFAAHAAKFIRLYLVLLEEKRLSLRAALFLYAHTTLFNLLIPFKLGEFYRIGAVSRVTGSIKTGISCVAVDRFFDTVALITLILPFELLFVGKIYMIPLLLFVALLLILFFYRSFEPSYRYLNHYLITKKKSERAFSTLRALDIINAWFQDIKRLVRGRSYLILLASYMGWSLEFLALNVFARSYSSYFGVAEINSYINSIFLGEPGTIVSMYNYVTLRLVGLGALIIGLYVLVRFIRRKEVQEN